MSRFVCIFCLTLACLGRMSQIVCADAATEYARPMPKVGVTELKGEFLPLDQGFIDENGQVVKLRQFFQAGRPVIVSMNYSKCPVMCNTQLSGLVKVIDEMTWHAGREFIVVSVSYDPLETPDQARIVKQNYLQQDVHAAGSDAWNFLTGKPTGIKRLADALGIQYEYIGERKEYAHPAVLVVCTPEGNISRYVYGVSFPAIQLQSWLEAASRGEIAQDDGTKSAMDFVLSCFYFDESAGVYTAQAWVALRVGVVLFVVAVAGMTFLCHRLVKSGQAKRRLQQQHVRQVASGFLSDPLGKPTG